jgi:hypothetical protein
VDSKGEKLTKLTSKEKKSQSNKQKKEGFKPLGSLTFFCFYAENSVTNLT